LAERAGDIPLLVNHFLAQHGFQKQFDESAMDALKAYAWPGNIRELKNVVERTCVLTREKVVCGKDISFLREGGMPVRETEVPADTEGNFAIEDAPCSIARPLTAVKKDMERRQIIHVLKSVNGNREEVAKVLGISPRTLFYKMKSYNQRARQSSP
jgi:two-component system NtrC family response regulator